jgi:hypothetical protein
MSSITRIRPVKKQHRRRKRNRPSQGDALLLPARQQRRRAVSKGAHLHEVQGPLDGLRNLHLGQLPHPKPIGDILGDAHMRPHGIGLEYHRDAAPFRRHVAPLGCGKNRFAVNADAASHRLLQTGDRAQGRGLAAARRTQQSYMLALSDGEADAIDRRDRVVANDQVGDLDGPFAHGSSRE